MLVLRYKNSFFFLESGVARAIPPPCYLRPCSELTNDPRVAWKHFWLMKVSKIRIYGGGDEGLIVGEIMQWFSGKVEHKFEPNFCVEFTHLGVDLTPMYDPDSCSTLPHGH